MKKRITFIFVLLTACIFITGNAFAAWTQAKGHMYNQLTLSYYTSDEKYSTLDEDNNIVSNHKIDNAKFESTNVTYYGAYGITDKITASLTVPYKIIEAEDVKLHTDSDGPSGVGDIDFGIRYNVSQNIFAGTLMSVDAKVKIPAAYDCDNPMAYQNLGDCQYDAQLSVVFGRGFGWGYAIADLGYKYRFEDTEFGQFKPSDQVKFRIDAGTNILSKLSPKLSPLSLRGFIDWSEAVGNSEVSDDFVEEAAANWGYAVGDGKEKIKRDSLGLEQKTLVVGAALAYSINSSFQVVAGAETGIEGFGHFETEDSGIGQTYSLAGVYMF